MKAIAKAPLIRASISVVFGAICTLGAVYLFGAVIEWNEPAVRSAHLAPDGSQEATLHIAQARQPGAISRIVKTFDSDEQTWAEIDARVPESSDTALGEPHEFDASWGRYRDAMRRPGPAFAVREEARGWPFPALWCWTTDGELADRVRYRGGINLSDPNNYETRGRVFPYLPVWRGLLIDVALFGVAWFAMLSIPAGIRRAWRRARRGACPGCGYQLSPELERCPECGRANRSAPVVQET